MMMGADPPEFVFDEVKDSMDEIRRKRSVEQSTLSEVVLWMKKII